MRPGIEFIFENEGDDAPGHIPGDVRVTLCAEPHTRFFWAGDDLATQTTIPIAAALLGGQLGQVQSITGEVIRLVVPDGAVVYPAAVLRVRGEGLPISTDPGRRGDLFVRLLVDFPRTLVLSPEDRETLRQILAPQLPPGGVDDGAPVAVAGAATDSEGTALAGGDGGAGLVDRELEPATDQDFGRGYPIVHPMVCAQQ
jgi:DnaJ-class molecular chaperone